MNRERNSVVHLLQAAEYGLMINNGVNGVFLDIASKAPFARELLGGH
jgi:hypothetical protein